MNMEMKLKVVNQAEQCDKCGGTGIAVSHVLNGNPVPYAHDHGVCYRCNGTGREPKPSKAQMNKLKALEHNYKIRVRWDEVISSKNAKDKICAIEHAISIGQVKRRKA